MKDIKPSLSPGLHYGTQGQGMGEYLIIVALIAITAIAIFMIFGKQMRETVTSFETQLAGETGGKDSTKIASEDDFGQSMESGEGTPGDKSAGMGRSAILKDLEETEGNYNILLFCLVIGLLIIGVILFMMFFLGKRK